MSYLIAKRIVENQKISIDCRYLEGSRYAWRMAEFALPDVNPLEKICIGGVHVSLRTILQRGALTEIEQKEIVSWLRKQDIKCKDFDAPLSYVEIIDLKNTLSKCRELTEYIKNHAKDNYDNTIGYLKQEGLFEDVTIAIVDSGWTGSMQQTLTRLIESGENVLKRSIQGFYFGLYELPVGACSNDYHCFFFEPYKNINRKVGFSNCLFEAVCSDSKGMTIGYRFDGKYVPVRETESNLNSDRIQRNVNWLLQLIAEPDYLVKCNLPIIEIEKRLKRLMSYPSKEEAELFGTYIFSDDVLSANSQHLAAKLSINEVRNLHVVRRLLIMKGIFKTALKDTSWPEGSIARNGRNQRWHLFENRVYKYLIYIRKYVYKGLRK